MLQRLELTNFRNYEKYSIDFAKTTILVGPNGIGKTNIIEAIYLISTGRSWRTNHDNEVVKWPARHASQGDAGGGVEVARITSDIANEESFELEMVIQKIPNPQYPMTKIVKINSVRKKLTDILGKLPQVLFSPEEIHLIDGPPQLRRRFLDILLCQIDKKYTLALLDLAKIIRGRNKLLYFLKIGRSKIEELAFWDEKLVALGSFIIKKRQKTVTKINEELTKKYQEISGIAETLELKYNPTVVPEKFAETLVAHRQREIDYTATLFGPHRDDLVFLLESKDITTFGSRGEYRSAVLALKMAELEYLAREKEERPLLLLDDIFSELDKNRRIHLAKIVGGQQTIITTTDLDHIEKNLREKAKIIEIEKHSDESFSH